MHADERYPAMSGPTERQMRRRPPDRLLHRAIEEKARGSFETGKPAGKHVYRSYRPGREPLSTRQSIAAAAIAPDSTRTLPRRRPDRDRTNRARAAPSSDSPPPWAT